MRIIEQNMVNAIQNSKPFSSSNTTVSIERNAYSQNIINVYLHGNHIAKITRRPLGVGDSVALSSAGWQTNTTKSRLNAIARELGVMGVYQKDYVWYFDNGDLFTEWKEQTL